MLQCTLQHFAGDFNLTLFTVLTRNFRNFQKQEQGQTATLGTTFWNQLVVLPLMLASLCFLVCAHSPFRS